MLEVGTVVYLQSGAEDAPADLAYGLVTHIEAALVIIEFPVSPTLLVAGDAVGICYKQDEKLYRLPAQVQMVLEAKPRMKVRFVVVGDPVLSDGRQTMRVTTATEKITVDAGSKPLGQLLDVSPDGMSVSLYCKHEIGEILQLSIAFRTITFAGKAIICNLRDMGDGRFRYGLKPAMREVALVRGMQNLASTIQRERRQREIDRRK